MTQRYRRGTSDACTAFRRYALLGLHKRCLNAFEMYECIRGMCATRVSALDMLAVYDTLRLLRVSEREECIAAIYAVYFYEVGRRPRKNDITYRARRLAYESHCDERTVYRRLQYAKKLYETVRKNQI